MTNTNGNLLQSNLDLSALSQTIQLFNQEVITPLKQVFVGKDEIIDLMGIALIARENLFLLGPPGTAKSALVRSLANRIDGRVFDYLLTKFTEPNELFGPFDIRKLRDGELLTNTEGMLPEADFVFLDELLNANSSILNSLLMALNERIFRRGRETRALPALFFVGASNRLPEDEALNALFDRFLLRVRCDNVSDESLPAVLRAGWAMQRFQLSSKSSISVESLRELQRAAESIDLSPVADTYIDLIRKMRRAGISISDRRAVKLQRPIAASVLLCGRSAANTTDLWVLKHIWDIQEQQEVLATMVESVLEQSSHENRDTAHPQSQRNAPPNAEEIATALDRLIDLLQSTDSSEDTLASKLQLRNQLAVLTTRSQWVTDEIQRSFLQEKVQVVWSKLQVIEGD